MLFYYVYIILPNDISLLSTMSGESLPPLGTTTGFNRTPHSRSVFSRFSPKWYGFGLTGLFFKIPRSEISSLFSSSSTWCWSALVWGDTCWSTTVTRTWFWSNAFSIVVPSVSVKLWRSVSPKCMSTVPAADVAVESKVVLDRRRRRKLFVDGGFPSVSTMLTRPDSAAKCTSVLQNSTRREGRRDWSSTTFLSLLSIFDSRTYLDSSTAIECLFGSALVVDEGADLYVTVRWYGLGLDELISIRLGEWLFVSSNIPLNVMIVPRGLAFGSWVGLAEFPGGGQVISPDRPSPLSVDVSMRDIDFCCCAGISSKP